MGIAAQTAIDKTHPIQSRDRKNNYCASASLVRRCNPKYPLRQGNVLLAGRRRPESQHVWNRPTKRFARTLFDKTPRELPAEELTGEAHKVGGGVGNLAYQMASRGSPLLVTGHHPPGTLFIPLTRDYGRDAIRLSPSMKATAIQCRAPNYPLGVRSIH